MVRTLVALYTMARSLDIILEVFLWHISNSLKILMNISEKVTEQLIFASMKLTI